MSDLRPVLERPATVRNPGFMDIPPAYSPSFAKPLAPRAAPPKRAPFIGFTRDEASATLLHEALGEYLPENNQIHVVDFRTALAILSATTTPEVILIDLSGEEQPINALMDLADVVESGTVVLAIGEVKNVSFYRTVTKGMGVREYLAKPLTRAAVERNFLSIIGKHEQESTTLRGGRMVAVTGARGGVGTSTLATNLAWYISAGLHRHTVLLDGELHTGTVALDLNVNFTNALGAALEAPDRVDPLFIERSMYYAGERLHVLAGQEVLEKTLDYKQGGISKITDILRARYNFVVADAGTQLSPVARDLLFYAQQRVIVLDPSMIAIRNLEKLLALPAGPAQSPRAMIVLNKAGTPGGLSQSYMEQTMGLRFDAVIPDLPRIVPRSTQFGTPAAALRGPFRLAIGKLAAALGATATGGTD